MYRRNSNEQDDYDYEDDFPNNVPIIHFDCKNGQPL